MLWGLMFNLVCCALQGVSIIVQSDRLAVDLETRVEAFLEEMCAILEEMPEDDFQKYAKALKSLFLEKPKSLREEFAVIYNEVIKRTYCFDYSKLICGPQLPASSHPCSS
jgi:secreted Zn-dependent insulinase-like peptidase